MGLAGPALGHPVEVSDDDRDGDHPDPTYSVTVVAEQAEAETASTTVLSGRDLSSVPRRNAEELLRQVPGLLLVQHGSEGKGHQFFLRGFDAVHGADLEVTVDGLPVNEWSNVHAQGYLDLGLVLPELVGEVRVVKGPFTLEQGAFGMAGSADYRLGVPLEARGWRAAYTFGTTMRHRVFAGYAPAGGADEEQFLGVSATHDQGYGDQRQLQRAVLNGRVRLLPARGGGLYATALGVVSAFELPGTVRDEDVAAGRVPFDGAYDARSEGSGARGLVALSWEEHRDRHQLRWTAYGGLRQLDLLENFTGYLLDPVNGDRRDQAQSTRSFGVHGAHDLDLSDPLTFRAGAGVRGEVISQAEDAVGQDLSLVSARRSLDATQLLAHLRAGLRWEPVSTLRFDAGGRLDLAALSVRDGLGADSEDPQRGQAWVPSPRASARWMPRPSLGLFLAYGRGFRPPEARAYTGFAPVRSGLDADAGGAPRPTVSDAGELGARWTPVPELSTTLSGFATMIQQESFFDHVAGVSVALSATRRVGAEAVVQVDPTPWLRLSSDLTVVDARFVASGEPVPLAPRVVSGTRAVWTNDSGVRGGLRTVAVAPRPLPNGAVGATLLLTDATLGWHGRRVRVDLEVENLSGRPLREGEYHYASHWQPGEPASELPVLHTTAGPPRNARLTLGASF